MRQARGGAAVVVTGVGFARPPYELTPLRTPKNQKFLSPGARHLLHAGLTAMEHAGWTRQTLPGARTAAFAASGQTGPEPADFFAAFEVARTPAGDPDWAALGGPASRLIDPYFSLRGLANAGLALLAMELGAEGPSNNFVQDAEAGLAALDAGIAAIEEGTADVVFCAASDYRLGAACQLAGEQPGRGDAEAGVALVLEEEARARERGAPRVFAIAREPRGRLDLRLGAAAALYRIAEDLMKTGEAIQT